MKAGTLIIKAIIDKKKFKKDLKDMNDDGNESAEQIEKSLKERLSMINALITKTYKEAGGGIKGILKVVKLLTGELLGAIKGVIMGVAKIGVSIGLALGVVALLAGAFLIVMEAIKKVGNENTTMKNDIKYIIFAIKTALQPAIDVVAGALVKIINFLITIFKYVLAIANAIAGRNLFEKATPEAFAKAMKESEKSSKGVAKNAKEIKKQLAGFDEMNILQDNKTGGGGGGSTPDYSTSFDASNLGDIGEKVQEQVDKFKKGWDEILKINMDDLMNMVAQTDDTWGILKAGWSALIQGIVFIFQGLLDIIGGILDILVGIFTGDVEKIKNGFVRLGTGILEIIRGALEVIVGLFVALIGIIVGIFKTIIDGIVSVFKAGYKWLDDNFFKPIGKVATNVWNTITTGLTNAFNKAKTTITNTWNTIKKLFSKGGDIFDGFKDGISSAFKSIVNLLITGINKVIKTPLDAVNKMLNKIHDVNILGVEPFKNLWSRNPIKIPVIPKLAKGGIINMPGRGTFVGSAIGGESGREGVIPLTDAQQMELLGEAIGRYITINANITNSMNGRIISRELQKIQNENTFAMNR